MTRTHLVSTHDLFINGLIVSGLRVMLDFATPTLKSLVQAKIHKFFFFKKSRNTTIRLKEKESDQMREATCPEHIREEPRERKKKRNRKREEPRTEEPGLVGLGCHASRCLAWPGSRMALAAWPRWRTTRLAWPGSRTARTAWTCAT